MSLAQRVGSLPTPRWAPTPLRDIYIAIALVATASSLLAVAQATLAFYPFPVWLSTGQYSGLFFNPSHAGATLALLAIVLIVHRLYWLLPGLAPGLYLSHSRVAWAALGLGLLATFFRRPLLLLVAALALAFLYTLHPSPSDLQRLEIWKAAYLNLTFWGNGIGSFDALYMGDPTCCLIHPEYAHNDYLQTVFELGIWSLIPFGVIALAVSHTSACDWPTLVTFLFIATFSMPLHMPIAALLGALALATTLGPAQ